MVRRWAIGVVLLSSWLLGALQAAPGFEVASVRMLPSQGHTPEELSRGIGVTSVAPFSSNTFRASNITLEYLIALAYGLENRQIRGGPDWINTQQYDITAKAEGDAGLTRAQMQPLLQHLLQQRFNLSVQLHTDQEQGYRLLVAKGGPKVQPSKAEQPSGVVYPGTIRSQGMTAKDIVSTLGIVLKRPVVDDTGLTGRYDLDIRYAPEEASDSPLPSLFTVLEEQLGLRLEARKLSVETLVITHLDKVPTEN